MFMHLYVVRHGTTDNNVNHLINGRNDNDINEKGIREAGMVSLTLKDVEFDKVYCSPLLRAKHTMNIINCNNFPVIYDERLMERDAGVMTNRSDTQLDLNLWENIDVGVIYGGSESFKSFVDRVSAFLDDLKEKYNDETILIVTHDGVIKAIEVYLFGYPGVAEIKNWGNFNCAIKQYKI